MLREGCFYLERVGVKPGVVAFTPHLDPRSWSELGSEGPGQLAVESRAVGGLGWAGARLGGCPGPGSGLASAHPLPPAGLSSVLALAHVGSPLVAFGHLAHLDSLSACPEAAWGQSHPCPQLPSSFLPISGVWGLWSASTPRPPRPSLRSRDSGLRPLLLFSLTLGPVSWQPPLSLNRGCAALPFTTSSPSAAWVPGLPQGWLPSLLIPSPAPWAQGWPHSLPLSSLWFRSCHGAATKTPEPIR